MDNNKRTKENESKVLKKNKLEVHNILKEADEDELIIAQVEERDKLRAKDKNRKFYSLEEIDEIMDNKKTKEELLIERKNKYLISKMSTEENGEIDTEFEKLITNFTKDIDLSLIFREEEFPEEIFDFCDEEVKKFEKIENRKKRANKEYSFEGMLYECERNPRKKFININTNEEFHYNDKEFTFKIKNEDGCLAPIKLTSKLLKDKFKEVLTEKE